MGRQVVHDGVEEPEVVGVAGGFDAGPGEDGEVDEVDARLVHQAQVLGAGGLVPLFGVVVAAESETAQPCAEGPGTVVCRRVHLPYPFRCFGT